ncbi:hypothetical protein VTL71DRAFT_3592 [Oculimacula yallundae]|uniref:Uncharacterized protein n=1 Tax=Oculimacula yallundae TaxID=86028 RepID=A0ABR4C8C6_9HELO
MPTNIISDPLDLSNVCSISITILKHSSQPGTQRCIARAQSTALRMSPKQHGKHDKRFSLNTMHAFPYDTIRPSF